MIRSVITRVVIGQLQFLEGRELFLENREASSRRGFLSKALEAE